MGLKAAFVGHGTRSLLPGVVCRDVGRAGRISEAAQAGRARLFFAEVGQSTPTLFQS